MYACLHLPPRENEIARLPELLALARDFSPEVEQTAADTVAFSIAPLRAIMGSVQHIVAEICRRGNERKLRAHLGVAANLDTAILLARCFSGVTWAGPREERLRLAAVPLEYLFVHDLPVDASLLSLLHQWGLQTCEDLASLPESGVKERLGAAGLYLRDLALGCHQRPLRISADETSYEERMDLDYPLEQLEPLLFLFGRVLSDLCGRLRSQSSAARKLLAELMLEDKPDYRCSLEFPVALDDSRTLLKLLQLHLECHPPGAAVTGFRLQIEPVSARRLQGGLFLPPMPQADKLQVTMARLAGLVGEDRVGTPQLVDSFHPDGFSLAAVDGALRRAVPEDSAPPVLRLSMRIYRPALQARVKVVDAVPRQVLAAHVKGRVVESSGPWKTTGEWWSPSIWRREEWDVGLDDGALYRIYCELPARSWYVHGMYD